MDTTQQLGERPIGSLLVRFSVPAVTGMLVQALYNTVDRVFIGHGVGPLALAGVAVSFPFMLITIAFAVLVSVGATSLISISLGEGRKDYAERVLGNAFVLLAAVGLVMTAAGLLLLEPLLRLFGASDEVLPYAVAFLQIILPGVAVSNLSWGMNNLIRGEGSPRTAMITMFIGSGANIALNPLFIFGLHMGIRGSALATVLSQALATAWVLSYYLRGGSTLKLRLACFRLDPSVLRRMLPIGAAPFAMQLAASVLNAAMNNQLFAYGGDLAISARGIIYTVDVLFFMLMVGINQGSQPIIGYNHGAGMTARVRKTIELTIVAATTLALLIWAATRLFPAGIIGLFGAGSPALLQLGSRGLTLTFLALPIAGFQMAAGGYFMAVGKSGQAIFLGMSRQILVIPGVYLLPRFLGLDGVFAAIPAADSLSFLLTFALFFREWRSLRAQEVGEGRLAAAA